MTMAFMILIVAWVVTRMLGSSCHSERGLRGRGRGRLADAESDRWLRSGESPRPVSAREGVGVQRRPARHERSVPVETPLEKLQREFASGALTIEQYEHEVGRLYGVRGEG